MKTELFKWLSWIIIGFALCAGFAARAATGPWVIELMKYSTNGYIVICKPIIDVQDHNRIGDDSYYSYETCVASADYKKFIRIWEKGKKKKLPKTNPLLQNLGDKVISVEQTPINDIRIDAYIKYFEKHSKKKIDRNKVFFGKIVEGTVGLCYPATQLVIMDKEWWNSSASAYSKEGLFYHELGHCYTNKDHNSAVTKKFDNLKELCPISLMNPTAFNYKDAYRCFHLHRKYYMAEVSTNKKKEFKVEVTASSYDNKLKKWITDEVLHDAKHKDTIKVGGYTCNVNRWGRKARKYEYEAEFITVACTKDHINSIILSHSCNEQMGDNLWKKGWANRSRTSSILQLHDSILNKYFSVSFKCSI